MPGVKALVRVICLFAFHSTFHLPPALLDITGAITAAGSWLVLTYDCVSPQIHMLKPNCQCNRIRR